MADPRAFVDKLVPSLIPVPAAQAGVCETCRSSCENSARCPQCESALQHFGTLPNIIPIALMTSESPLYEALRAYKGQAGDEVRRRHRLTAAALLATYVRWHSHCLGDYDSVTAIPSQSRTAVAELINSIGELRDRYFGALASNGPWASRELRSDRYRVTRHIEGERILVIDDTFTSGATVLSACKALSTAGAKVVGRIVIGRFIRVGWPPSDLLLQRLAGQPWTHEVCIRCAGGVLLPGSTLC